MFPEVGPPKYWALTDVIERIGNNLVDNSDMSRKLRYAGTAAPIINGSGRDGLGELRAL